MGEPIIQHCEVCNTEQFHQKDSRKNKEQFQEAQIIQFPDIRRRSKSDRRKVLDCRIVDHSPSERTDKPKSKRCRLFDGHAWFIDTVEDAIKKQWIA